MRWTPPLPPATTRLLAGDDVTMETYYYGRQSVLIGRRSRDKHYCTDQERR